MSGDITILTKANTKSNSLRTTIPMSITKHFGLKEGGHLRWDIQAERKPVDCGGESA